MTITTINRLNTGIVCLLDRRSKKRWTHDTQQGTLIKSYKRYVLEDSKGNILFRYTGNNRTIMAKMLKDLMGYNEPIALWHNGINVTVYPDCYIDNITKQHYFVQDVVNEVLDKLNM